LIVAILHDLNLAALLGERILVLDRGRLDSQGTPSEATITSQMLLRVFAIEATVNAAPTTDVPFVLPQAMATAKGVIEV
jgi:heme transport system ATP-binding protein